jgi:hypothetical protein
MARTWREQWADNWLLIVVHMISWAGGLVPIIIAWGKQMAEMGWIICAVASGFLIVGSGLYIFSRSERKGKTTTGTSTFLSDGDLTDSPSGPQVYVIHQGKRHWLATPDIAGRVNPQWSGLRMSIHPTLLNRIPKGPDINTPKDITKYLRAK